MTFALVVSTFQGNGLGAVQVYDSTNGSLVRQQQIAGFAPTGLDFGPNGDLFVGDNNSVDAVVSQFDEQPLSLRSRVAVDPAGGITDLEFSPEGNLYIAGDTFIRIFNGQTGASLGFFNVSLTFFPQGMTFGPDGNLYVNNSINGTLLILDRFSGGILRTIPGVSGTGDLAFDNNGNLFVVSGNSINFLNASGSGTFVTGLNTPRSLAVGPNGNLFVTVTGDNTIREFNISTGSLVRTYSVQGTPSHITFFNDLSIGATPGGSPTPPGTSPTPPGSPTPPQRTPRNRNVVRGTNRNDRLAGTRQRDRLLGFQGRDRLTGKGGNDILIGGGGRDRLKGGGGRDKLTGGPGRDILDGGAGTDRLRGKGGPDTFVLKTGNGRDKIFDFKNGQDKLGLSRSLDFRDLDILRRGQNTLIRADGDPLAILQGVRANVIGRNDFV